MPNKLKNADRLARSKFRYVSETRDQWRSHAEAVLAGRSWTGDCDDLASTTAELAVRENIPLKDIWFVAVSSNRDGKVDHLIGVARASTGALWVIGDTFAPAYKLVDIPHQIVSVHNLTWRLSDWRGPGALK